MSRIIAIDYGRKRTGIAVSDTLQMIANGLTTVPTHQLLQFLLDYVAKEPVERILVGFPKQMNNEASENMKNIEVTGIAYRIFLRKYEEGHGCESWIEGFSLLPGFRCRVLWDSVAVHIFLRNILYTFRY